MTNEEAIKMLKSKMDGHTDTSYEWAETVRMAIKALEQEPIWIPVSERMPEDRKPVLVTAYWHETYQVMQASYFGDGVWWCVPFNNTGEHEQKLKPKAWMSLPESYKAESEDKE